MRRVQEFRLREHKAVDDRLMDLLQHKPEALHTALTEKTQAFRSAKREYDALSPQLDRAQERLERAQANLQEASSKKKANKTQLTRWTQAAQNLRQRLEDARSAGEDTRPIEEKLEDATQKISEFSQTFSTRRLAHECAHAEAEVEALNKKMRALSDYTSLSPAAKLLLAPNNEQISAYFPPSRVPSFNPSVNEEASEELERSLEASPPVVIPEDTVSRPPPPLGAGPPPPPPPPPPRPLNTERPPAEALLIAPPQAGALMAAIRARGTKPQTSGISYPDFLKLKKLDGALVQGKNNPFTKLWKLYRENGDITEEQLAKAKAKVDDTGQPPSEGDMQAEMKKRFEQMRQVMHEEPNKSEKEASGDWAEDD